MNLEEAKEIVSYGIGFRLGNQLKNDSSLDHEIVVKSITEVFNGEASEPNEETFQEAAAMVQEESAKELRSASEAFIEENKGKEGIQVTDSGLQYRVIEEGEGDSPKVSDQVVVHYTGRLVDGSVFDSSVQRGEPAHFGVNQVIPGWVEGLQLMKVGAKYEFFIPQELAYGEQGSQGAIPPYSALVFEVELIEIAADSMT